MPVYADNPSNRKLNRVGLEKGSVPAPLSPRRQAGGARAGKKNAPQGPQPNPGGAPKKVEDASGGIVNAPKGKGHSGVGATQKGNKKIMKKIEKTGEIPSNVNLAYLKKREASLKSQAAKYKKGFYAAGGIKGTSAGLYGDWRTGLDPSDTHSSQTSDNIEVKLNRVKELIADLKKKEAANIDLSNKNKEASRGPPVALVLKYPSVKSMRGQIGEETMSNEYNREQARKGRPVSINMSVKPAINTMKIAPKGFHVMPDGTLMKDEVHTLKQKGPASIKMSVKPAINKVKSVNEVIESNPTIKRMRKDIKITKGKIKKYEGENEPKWVKKRKKYKTLLKEEEEKLASMRKQLHPNFGKY